ncbi:endo-1,4-beta-xylanase [Microbacterium sp. NEAU-LLC]|uniref:Endo-1,4-beta-xylanase n=1 Tax=Microbacterium helvum TaxID=2773713 RepID=A0ABR8NRP4_9MICO|nr:endo-1,4-beta-xylanase [Microbacterium helvum]MBD3943208.1 endo-1,4-beta-xylanase [Microbacterium helvum]
MAVPSAARHVAASASHPRHRRRAWPAVTVLPLTVGLIAAGVTPAHAADEYSVDIHVTGGGVVTGAGNFTPGETVTLTATPDAGNVWGGWTSDELDWIGARVASFTMPEGDVEIDTAFRPQAAPLKDVYAADFEIGNIWGGSGDYAAGSASSNHIARNYSVMTAGNAMKPDALLPNNNIDPTTGAFTFNWGNADGFVDSTIARGMRVHGHVLVWHSQSPARLNTGTTGGTRDLARENMRRYIEGVLGHFDGRVPTWDVVNEAFVDGLDRFDPATQDWRDYLRGGPNGGTSAWYAAYANGTDAAAGEDPGDYIYDAFSFARQYGPGVTLVYNDFNEFQASGKGKAIVTMATDLNARYAAEHPGDARPLIEVLGMQSHNYIPQTPAFACSSTSRLGALVDDTAEVWQTGACSDSTSVEAFLQLVDDAGLRADISELDLFVWEAYNGQPEGSSPSAYRDLTDPAVKDRISRDTFTFWQGKIANRAELEEIQAQRYAEYFSVYKAYADIIDRVTFWGMNDRFSWRATHNPLLLNSDWSEKLAMWAVSDPEGWFDRDRADGDGIPVQATVAETAPGSLTLSVADFGDGVVLSQGADAGDRLRFTGQLPEVTVTDSRTAEQAGDGGWAVTGRSTDLASGGDTVAAGHLGWTPQVVSPRAGVAAGAAIGTVLDGAAGLAAPQALATASVAGRFGSTTLGAALALELPVDQAPGTYRGTVSVSLFPVD